MDIFGKLFGNPARIRLIRFFLANTETIFDTKTVAEKSKVAPVEVRQGVAALAAVGLIQEKTLKAGEGIHRGTKHWCLNKRFPHQKELAALLMSSKSFKRDDIAKRFAGAGKLKLLLVSGIFLQNDHGPVDILIVGEPLRKSFIRRVLKSIEAEIGIEIRYAVFSPAAFEYRLSMHDKFIRDIMDFPKEVLVDKLGVIL